MSFETLWSRRPSSFVVGPIRGDYENLQRILRREQLINDTGAWQGGHAVLVAFGPFLGKGGDGAKALRCLEILAEQTQRIRVGRVSLVKAPGEDIAGHSYGQFVRDDWLVTAPGISGPSLGKAWAAARVSDVRGDLFRPNIPTVLSRFLETETRFLDGAPSVSSRPLQLIKGQICSAGGEPRARVEWMRGNVLRLESGLGCGDALAYLCSSGDKWQDVVLPPAQEHLRELKARFTKVFGMAYPAALEPDPGVELLPPESPFLLSVSRVGKQTCVQDPFYPSLFLRAPVGIWMAGWWGDVLFYIVRKDARREVFLRLNMNLNLPPDIGAVRAFLRRYLAFDKWAESYLHRWQIINNLGDCSGWMQSHQGGGCEYLPSAPEHKFRFPNEISR